MSMMYLKKRVGLPQWTMLGLLVLVIVASPLSLLIDNGELALRNNVAEAANCTETAGGVSLQQVTQNGQVVMRNGQPVCQGTNNLIYYYRPDGVLVNGDTGIPFSDSQTEPGLGHPDAAAVGLDRPGTCTWIVDCLIALPVALWDTVVTLLAGTLIEISRWFLIIAGTLFNWLMDFTIIKFGAFYTQSVKTAVETAWTAFRDIANIFIIGIFTYIAINIILGAKEFGQKKMIASVLIVAVLINFSLLFTKMVIDASNYTAAQIYTAAALGGTATAQGGQAGSATKNTNYGIADQFMNLLGVGTFGDAFKTVDEIAQAKGGSWKAPLHGILVMIIILGAAMVLFYGCFLLISRMIMLIFLMVTAAVAVASYLIPDWGTSNYGFKAWKSSLIWCATFAPMLMIFLWMTLNVSYALKGKSNATLGAALSNPIGGDNIGALFNYVMVLGLLFTTFKLSSMWANKIGGFNYAAMLPGLGVAGVGRLAGILGKNTVGLGSKYLSDRASKIGAQHDADKNYVRSALYGGLARQLEKPYKRDFNLMNTKYGKEISGIAGLKGTWAGQTKGKGLEGDDKAAAEIYAKRSEKAAEISRKDLEKNKGVLLKEAAKGLADLPENRERKKQLRTMEETAKEQLEQSKKAQESNKEALTKATEKHETEKTAAENAIKKSEENMKTIVSQLERDKEYAPKGTKGRQDMEDQIVAARAEHESNMNREKAKITSASAEVARIQSLAKANEEAISGAEKGLKEVAKGYEEFDKDMEAKALDNVSAEKIAGKMVPARLTNILGTEEDRDHLTALTRKHIKETGEERSLKRLINKQVEATKAMQESAEASKEATEASKEATEATKSAADDHH
ncbi:MAG: hypothetical protein Q7R90_03980 [bacterium]|nr:hypothetical protein [bacterium]